MFERTHFDALLIDFLMQARKAQDEKREARQRRKQPAQRKQR